MFRCLLWEFIYFTASIKADIVFSSPLTVYLKNTFLTWLRRSAYCKIKVLSTTKELKTSCQSNLATPLLRDKGRESFYYCNGVKDSIQQPRLYPSVSPNLMPKYLENLTDREDEVWIEVWIVVLNKILSYLVSQVNLCTKNHMGQIMVFFSTI